MESGQNVEKSGKENREPDYSKREISDSVPQPISTESGLPSNPIPSEPSQSRAGGDSSPIKPHPPNWCEKLTLLLELFGVIGLGIYCVYTIKEWETFDSENKTMAEELKENRITRELDERAWLNFDNLGIDRPFTADHFVFRMSVVNSGKTPARVDSIIVRQWFTDPTFMETNAMRETPLGPGPLILAPNSSQFLEIGNGMDTNQFNLLTQRKVLRLFFIKIQYRDVFGNVRHTEACYIIAGPEGIYAPGNFFTQYGPSVMD